MTASSQVVTFALAVTGSDPGDYDPEIHELIEAQQQLQDEAADLVGHYRDRCSHAVVGYVLDQVRSVCTQQDPATFLALDQEQQQELVDQIREIAFGLQSTIGTMSLMIQSNPWAELETRLGPQIRFAEQHLTRILQSLGIGRTEMEMNDRPLTPLSLLELEQHDQTLRHLRAQLQVISARIGRIERQLEILAEKQLRAQAEIRWQEITKIE